MTREEAASWLKDSIIGEGYQCPKEVYEMAIQALEQPECEDAVSREKVAVHIARTNAVQKMSMTDWNEILDAIEAVPLVTPKQPGWTYIEEALPKTVINEHTHDYQEYNCLCDFGVYGFDVRTYKFGYGHFRNGGGIVDKYVTAWQPLPEIPDALKSQPGEGEGHE